MTLLLAFFIGFFGGLRSLTAPAATAWAVYLGWLKLDGPLSAIGSTVSVVIFTVLAVGELIADKLPWMPSRTAPPGLIARIALGGLTGACLSSAGGQGIILGGVSGAAGGIAGCFLGYQARTRLVKALGTADLNVALFEDLVAIAGGVWVVTQ